MPYSSSYTDYPANQPRPDADGQIVWVQAHLIQNYNADKYIVVDKEIKGGLHRVKYKSQLYQYNYDGIFQSRRVKGMIAYVELEDDDTPLGKYYSLIMLPGDTPDQWAEHGSGANVVLNNPITVQDLPERDALTPLPNDFVNVVDARTESEIEADIDPYSASFIWDGSQWLRIYPYAANPNNHVQNTDTGLLILGVYKSGDDIWNTITDPSYRKRYNDATSVDSAAAATVGPDGQGVEAWTSKKVAQELKQRPPIVPDGDPKLFLNMIGQWAVPSSGGGGGTSLLPGDILGGGGADESYYS